MTQQAQAPTPIITIEQAGRFAAQTVTIRGWLYNMRESGKLLFPIFRDGTGVIQGVVSLKEQPQAFEALKGLPQESSVIVTGKIQPEFVERLHAMGEWLRKNGDSIYGTRGGPVTPRPWGVTTQKAGKIYVHVFDWSDELLALPKLANVRSAAVLGAGTAVEVRQEAGGTVLRLPAGRDPVDTVIVLATD